MVVRPKSERFAIRMDADERRMLRELAAADGMADAVVVRLLIRRAHAERFGEAPPKSKPKR